MEGGGDKRSQTILSLAVNEAFDLEKAVCSYGFFMMAPNLWISYIRTLYRPLRLANEASVSVLISQKGSFLQIRVLGLATLTQQDETSLLNQVKRMLRLSTSDELAVKGFHALHPEAKAQGFGRIFRSPTLFEDIVKGMLLCNCRWKRTLSMASQLCELQSELCGKPVGWETAQTFVPSSLYVHLSGEAPKKAVRKKKGSKKLRTDMSDGPANHVPNNLSENIGLNSDYKGIGNTTLGGSISKETPENVSSLTNEPFSLQPHSVGRYYNPLSIGNFPTPQELANLNEDFLAKRCGLGYRAARILILAKNICKGDTDLKSLDYPDGSTGMEFEELKEYLMKLDGIGPFTCAVILMCMGNYQCIPIDTETIRHLKQVVGISRCTTQTVARDVEDTYAKFAPFQFLAYWWEMWDSYERKFGRLSQMLPSDYALISGNNMKRSKHYVLEQQKDEGLEIA